MVYQKYNDPETVNSAVTFVEDFFVKYKYSPKVIQTAAFLGLAIGTTRKVLDEAVSQKRLIHVPHESRAYRPKNVDVRRLSVK